MLAGYFQLFSPTVPLIYHFNVKTITFSSVQIQYMENNRIFVGETAHRLYAKVLFESIRISKLMSVRILTSS